MSGSLTVGVSKLIADQAFSALAALEAKPNLFRAVGQSNRETWHSAFLGWLLSPEGSHGLGRFPLQLFLTSLADERVIPPTIDEDSKKHFCLTPDEVCRLASTLQLERLQVQPSEGKNLGTEYNIMPGGSGKTGSIDVWCQPKVSDKGSDGAPLFIAVEMKVDAKTTNKQTERYAEHVMECVKTFGKEAKGLMVFIDPQDSNSEKAEKIAGDPRYFCTNYQVLHDMVLAPCLEHPNLHPEMGVLLSHYIRNLRTARKAKIRKDQPKNSQPKKLRRLAYTHREQHLCREISEEYLELLGQLNEVHKKNIKNRNRDEETALEIVLDDTRSRSNKVVFGLLMDLIDFLRNPDDEGKDERFPEVEALIKLFVPPRPKNIRHLFQVNDEKEPRQGAGKIALHVVQLWADRRRENHEPIDLATLQEAWPASLVAKGFGKHFGYIVSQQDADAENKRGTTKRYFTKKEELISGINGQLYAVSSQWDKLSIPALMNHLIQHHPAIKVKWLTPPA